MTIIEKADSIMEVLGEIYDRFLDSSEGDISCSPHEDEIIHSNFARATEIYEEDPALFIELYDIDGMDECDILVEILLKEGEGD